MLSAIGAAAMTLQHTGLANLRAPQNPTFNPTPILAPPFPNTLSFLPFYSTSPSHGKTKTTQLGFHNRIKCSISHIDHPVLYPKPSEIPWKKELCNAVQLIGVVGVPVELKHLNSGKALAWTRLGVRKSATDTTWINLTFWDELAHIAHQHIEKGNRIYVAGRLVSDTVEIDDDKQQTYYKVVVHELNFVENSFSAAPSYERETSTAEDRKPTTYTSNTGASTQELWQAFFANPLEWWDNRKSKRNPKYPDFKHKDTGEALWVEGKYNPPWVKSQLAILDFRMESLHVHEASTPLDLVAGGETTSF